VFNPAWPGRRFRLREFTEFLYPLKENRQEPAFMPVAERLPLREINVPETKKQFAPDGF
jgi:hypothetical protein